MTAEEARKLTQEAIKENKESYIKLLIDKIDNRIIEATKQEEYQVQFRVMSEYVGIIANHYRKNGFNFGLCAGDITTNITLYWKE